MNKQCLLMSLVTASALVTFSNSAAALSTLPQSFDEMIAESKEVVIGVVQSKQYAQKLSHERSTASAPVAVTRHFFNDSQIISGGRISAKVDYSLDLPGGVQFPELDRNQAEKVLRQNTRSVDAYLVKENRHQVYERSGIAGMPSLNQGQRLLVLVSKYATAPQPIVGESRGIFRIGSDGGVYTYEGTAVTGIRNGRLVLAKRAFDLNQARDQHLVYSEGGTDRVLYYSNARTQKSTAKPISLNRFQAYIANRQRNL